MQSKLYKFAMVMSQRGADIQKVAKKVAEKSHRLGAFLQIRALSQRSEREWIGG
jgi:hypothetical protein